MLRGLETWLHQHIFKVGWLVTNDYQVTTVLYYAFFLPGIVLNQFIFWAVAGLINVRADRSIAWPEKQEIGELKLNFIKISNKIGAFKLAVISTVPLIVGIFAVWQIANNTLKVTEFLAAIQNGTLDSFSPAVRQFTAAPDFWIWVYIAFTISNTMMPDFAHLRGWRVILIGLGVILFVLYILGAGNAVLMDALRGPITDSLNALSGIFAVIIGVDLFMVAVLGTLEAIIERVTGDSATFENGKMKTMRRKEMLAERAKKALTVRQKAAPAPAAPVGAPSIYKMLLPIPQGPGKEAVTRDEGIIIEPEPTPALPAPSSPAGIPSIGRAGASMITGTVTEKTSTDVKPTTPALPASTTTEKPATPMFSRPASTTAPTVPPPPPRPITISPAPKPGAVDDDDDIDDEDEDDEDERGGLDYEDFEDPA